MREETGVLRRMAFPSGDRTFYVRPIDILWIEAAGNYSRIFTDQTEYLVRGNVGSLEGRLADLGFFRAHRSVIVNPRRIVEIRRTARRAVIVLENGALVPLTAGSRADLERLLEK